MCSDLFSLEEGIPALTLFIVNGDAIYNVAYFVSLSGLVKRIHYRLPHVSITSSNLSWELFFPKEGIPARTFVIINGDAIYNVAYFVSRSSSSVNYCAPLSGVAILATANHLAPVERSKD